MARITGVAFPIPKLYIPRFFTEGKTVFIKPATIHKYLQVGMKFIFYQSQIETGYVGEAVIKKITISDDPFQIYNIYKNKIFLTEAELEKYAIEINKWKAGCHRRFGPKNRNWIAIELDSIQKYNVPIRPKRFVGVSGKYIRNDQEIEDY